ncbi:hypothetical protein ACFPRL_01025 [Pseudoclavibacter helvolus]
MGSSPASPTARKAWSRRKAGSGPSLFLGCHWDKRGTSPEQGHSASSWSGDAAASAEGTELHLGACASFSTTSPSPARGRSTSKLLRDRLTSITPF